MDISASHSALQAYGLRQQAAAHNVANMNTDGFSPSRVDLEEIQDNGGVRGRVVSSNQVGAETGPAATQPAGDQEQPAEGFESGREPSRTDVVNEFTTMMENETAYSANAAVIRTNQQMTGEVLNLLA